MKKNILISGASFAGLSTAYWMNQLGYNVTVVEIGKGLNKGGAPVNIRKNTADILKRMGLLDQIRSNSIPGEGVETKSSNGDTALSDFILKRLEGDKYEIERDVLLNIMFAAVKDDVEFIFNDSITSLKEESNGVDVNFKWRQKRPFDLVFGCDGIHSVVRKLSFGKEADFSYFLKVYFSTTIVNKLLIQENTTQGYNESDKAVMLNAYNNKTDIVLYFSSEKEIPYDYRNEEQKRNIIFNQLSGTGWRTSELLEEVKKSKNFYFGKMCQIKMPSWTKGRVALVGDAGYCASPAAGMGGSLAIDGAGALADAFQKYHGSYKLAFEEYNKSLRPFIEEVQATAEKVVELMFPRTKEAIHERN